MAPLLLKQKSKYTEINGRFSSNKHDRIYTDSKLAALHHQTELKTLDKKQFTSVTKDWIIWIIYVGGISTSTSSLLVNKSQGWAWARPREQQGGLPCSIALYTAIDIFSGQDHTPYPPFHRSHPSHPTQHLQISHTIITPSWANETISSARKEHISLSSFWNSLLSLAGTPLTVTPCWGQ